MVNVEEFNGTVGKKLKWQHMGFAKRDVAHNETRS